MLATSGYETVSEVQRNFSNRQRHTHHRCSGVLSLLRRKRTLLRSSLFVVDGDVRNFLALRIRTGSGDGAGLAIP